MGISLILIIIATVLWFLESVHLPKDMAVSFGWLGMVFFGLSMIIK